MNGPYICGLLWAIFGCVWLIAWMRTKRTQERAPLSFRLLYGVPVAIASYLMFNDNAALRWRGVHFVPRTPLIQSAGILLTAAGIAFAIWARFYLGQNWSSAVSIKVGHQLIRTGPYQWVRHPIYSGLLIALLGTALARGKMISLAALPLFFLGFWTKSRMEEQFMRKTFGQEYEDYSQSTGALVPKF
jgi:protein-S-isoprenylcysteine O-methyltransferase Ste14